MENIKYVMLPRIEEKPKVVKQQPWYKERMKEKYLTKNHTQNKEKILDPKQWLFIKDGLDDFRDGIPPPCDDLFLKPSKGPSPTIKNYSRKFQETAMPISKRLNKNQRFFSKKIPLAEARRDNIDQIIEGLAQHPLALYPHLEETLPPDLFEEILELLDPEINEQTESVVNDFDSTPISPNKLSKTQEDIQYKIRRNIREDLKKLEENLTKENADNGGAKANKTVKNTYKWLLKKEDAKSKTKGPEPEQMKAIAIDNHIKKVTEEFCEWVKSLGGEHNIDPITLTSLFASGYDTKPALSVPIHVVELTNIPAELRPQAYVPPDPNSKDESFKPGSKNVFRDDTPTKKKGEPLKYGAWYLPKQHWRLMPVSEKLVDPRLVKEAEKDESKKKAEEINSKLAPLHGAQAFKEFVKNKQPKRVPKLLEELEEWQTEQTNKTLASQGLRSSSNQNLMGSSSLIESTTLINQNE